MKAPRCERKGTLPHPASNVLVWDLLSGRYTRCFCDEHAKDARPKPHYIAKLVDYVERAKAFPEEE